MNGHALSAGDALPADGREFVLERGADAEALAFDLPGNWPPR